jgi:shikimate kinase
MSEIEQLRTAANELAAQGDVLSAMILDDIAYLLARGHEWKNLLDDVQVREPYLN